MVWNNFVLPRYVLQRHPLTVTAHFAHSLVLTYAFPAKDELVARMLLPGLDGGQILKDFGFVATCWCKRRVLRPTLLPRGFINLFFLAGYQDFCEV